MSQQGKVQLVPAARRGAAQTLWLHMPAQESFSLCLFCLCTYEVISYKHSRESGRNAVTGDVSSQEAQGLQKAQGRGACRANVEAFTRMPTRSPKGLDPCVPAVYSGKGTAINSSIMVTAKSLAIWACLPRPCLSLRSYPRHRPGGW